MRKNKSILLILFTLLGSQLFAQTLTLDSCLRLAQENHAAIRKAELDVERAKQVRMQALTKFFPQVQGTAAAFHALDPLVDVSLDDLDEGTVHDVLDFIYGNLGTELGLQNNLALFRHGFVAGVTAVQPVFMGGKIIAGNKLAKLGVEAAQLQQQITERDVLEEVEESYWLVAGLQDKQRTLRQATLLLDTLEHLVSSAVDAGLALETDRMQLLLKRSELQRQQLMLESGLTLAKRALAQAINLPQGGVEGVLTVPGVEGVAADSSTHYLLPTASSPEASLLQLQTQAARLERAMAVADALPKVAAGANYAYSRTDANILKDHLEGWNGALFATVSVPLTGWWETAHKIREHSIRLEQAEIDRRNLTEKLELRKQQAYDEMMLAEMLVQQSERALRLQQQRMHLTEIGYRAGTTSIAELLTAQTDLLAAENDLTDARIALAVRTRRYYDL